MLLFEMLTGSAPFRAKNRAVLQKKIMSEKIKYPSFLTSAAHKLLTGLLQRDEVRVDTGETNGRLFERRAQAILVCASCGADCFTP